MTLRLFTPLVLLAVTLTPAAGQRRGEPNPFPGGTNPDGSLRPTPPLIRLFTQDAYTPQSPRRPQRKLIILCVLCELATDPL